METDIADHMRIDDNILFIDNIDFVFLLDIFNDLFLSPVVINVITFFVTKADFAK